MNYLTVYVSNWGFLSVVLIRYIYKFALTPRRVGILWIFFHIFPWNPPAFLLPPILTLSPKCVVPFPGSLRHHFFWHPGWDRDLGASLWIRSTLQGILSCWDRDRLLTLFSIHPPTPCLVFHPCRATPTSPACRARCAAGITLRRSASVGLDFFLPGSYL